MSLSKYVHEDTFRWWLMTPVADVFKHFAPFVRLPDDNIKHHIFIDRGANILVIAHLDHVRPIEDAPLWDNEHILSRNLDDRLGCALAFNSKEYGLHADVLLCDHEEIGQSTAKYFKTEKEYKWVVEFDRAGEDYVTYNLDSKEWNEALKTHGFKKGRGAFSDICALNLPGKPACMNIGTGYHNAHQDTSWADIGELNRNMDRLMAFHEEHKDSVFKNDGSSIPKYATYSSWSSSKRARRNKRKDTSVVWQCSCCGVLLFNHQVAGVCTVCFGDLQPITNKLLNKEA